MSIGLPGCLRSGSLKRSLPASCIASVPGGEITWAPDTTRHDNHATTRCQATGMAFRATVGRDRNFRNRRGFLIYRDIKRHRWHRHVWCGDFLDFLCGFIVWHSLCYFVSGSGGSWSKLGTSGLETQFAKKRHAWFSDVKPFQRISYFTTDWDSWSCERASRSGLCKEPSPGLSQRQSQQSPKTSHEKIWDNQMIIYQIISKKHLISIIQV